MQSKPAPGQPQSSNKSNPTHAAPPAYRPQPVPKVLQTKKPVAPVSHSRLHHAPAAPPVYRPQPVPKVLQRQATPPQREAAPRVNKQTVAPAVSKPQPVSKVLQRKASDKAVENSRRQDVVRPAPAHGSVIQPLWMNVEGGVGEWKKGNGDAPQSKYLHVGDFLFRRYVDNNLGEQLFKWTPKENKLQSVRLTRAMGQELEKGMYDTGVNFDPKMEGAQQVSNITLYGLQHFPMKWIEYDTKTSKFVYHDMEKDAHTELNFPSTFNVSNWREHGVKYQGEKYYAMNGKQTGVKKTGLEQASKILFYLKEFKEIASPTIVPNSSLTGIPISGQKAISDRITRDNILLWEPIKTRSATQKSVMNNVSAAEEAKSLGINIAEPREWHWCHLIAHSMGALGNPQVPENLVAGTAACNGAMAHLEMAIKQYVKDTEKDLSVIVTAQLIGATHVANRITYRVDELQSGKSAIFYFHPLNPNKSAVQHADYYASVLVDKLGGKLSDNERAKLIRVMTGEKHIHTPQRSSTFTNQVSPDLSSPIANIFNSPTPSSPYSPPTSTRVTNASSSSPTIPDANQTQTGQLPPHIAEEATNKGHIVTKRGTGS